MTVRRNRPPDRPWRAAAITAMVSAGASGPSVPMRRPSFRAIFSRFRASATMQPAPSTFHGPRSRDFSHPNQSSEARSSFCDGLAPDALSPVHRSPVPPPVSQTIGTVNQPSFRSPQRWQTLMTGFRLESYDPNAGAKPAVPPIIWIPAECAMLPPTRSATRLTSGSIVMSAYLPPDWEAFEPLRQAHRYFKDGMPKTQAERDIAMLIVPERNASTSFRTFYNAIVEPTSQSARGYSREIFPQRPTTLPPLRRRTLPELPPPVAAPGNFSRAARQRSARGIGTRRQPDPARPRECPPRHTHRGHQPVGPEDCGG